GGPDMNGKKSGKTPGVARVFLGKHTRKTPFFFRIKPCGRRDGCRVRASGTGAGKTSDCPLWLGSVWISRRIIGRYLSFDGHAQFPAMWRGMPNPVIQSLLILQDRDLKRLGLEAQLKQVPGDIERVEQKIAAEKSAID